MSDWKKIFDEPTAPEFDQKVLQKAEAELAKLRESSAADQSKRNWIRMFIVGLSTAAAGLVGWIIWRQAKTNSEIGTDSLAFEFNPDPMEFELMADENVDLANDVEFFEDFDALENMEEEA